MLCAEALAPIRFDIQSGGGRLVLEFNTATVDITLPDGSVQTVDRAEAAFLADGALPATTALIYAALADNVQIDADAEPLRLRLFLVNTLVSVPYETYPSDEPAEPDACWHQTSHRTHVLLNKKGLMLAVRVPDSGLEVILDREAPPAPEWPEILGPDAPLLAYQPPPQRRFQLEDVEIPGPVTPIGATLSIPSGSTSSAVLFISGSGVHDRHGIAGEFDIGSHEILDDLAEHGVLGLRFDTRGAGTTRLGGDILDRGLGSDIGDARACLEYLRKRPEASGRPVFLIGHSQGATIAMALAGEESVRTRLSGLVLMAAMGRDLNEVSADQIQVEGRRLGLEEAQIKTLQADTHKVAELIRSGEGWDETRVPHHLLALYRTQTWYADFLRYRPTELIGEVPVPILLCQGGADFQVSPERDAEPLLAAARQSRRDCTYALFPGLDHFFKRSAGQSSVTEYLETRPVAPEFLSRIRAWLNDHGEIKS